uniref:non-specific serine/threonine protein kinase n=2 Tax=Gloeothece TaxID=28070 RepID=E0UES6_GLOV7|nr:serine/threonine protein kinase [Gloeothece verrucosa PCC 7822]
MGKLLDGRYQVTQILSQGGFGRTFLALDTKLPGNPICVVKQLHPATSSSSVLLKAQELFEREAKILQQLGEHPNIPRLLAYFEENKEFYLVEEYIVGKPLSAEFLIGQPLLEEQVITILVELLENLNFVHQNQVIHRDIKPDNIIRRSLDKKLVLIDFGSVKEVTQKDNSSKTLIGTPGYIPVEQAVGNPRFNSDLYAVGIIGIQALTGQMPQELPRNFNTEQILWHDLAKVTPELASILDKMICHDYRDRYQSAREVLEDIHRLIWSGQPGPVPTQPSPLPTQPHSLPTQLIDAEPKIKSPQKNNNSLVMIGGVASLVVLAAIGGGVIFSQIESIPNPKLSLNGKILDGFLTEQDKVFKKNSLNPLAPSDHQIFYYKDYYFKGNQGQKISIEMTSQQIDPSLKLVFPNSVDGVENDDISPSNPNAKIVVDLPETGIYKVIVTSSQPQETGSYQLSGKKL